MQHNYSINKLNSFDDQRLKELDWKNLIHLNSRLLELHAEGELGNEKFAKLPRRPILCIDQIDLIDDTSIEASFTFPQDAKDWPYDINESLEMLFQDQLDQLVGFWGCRKVDGIGRALSSGVCTLHQTLDFIPGESILFRLDKKKWMKNKTDDGGTAVFNGRVLSDKRGMLLETRNVIVGILRPADIHALREQFGGTEGVVSENLDYDATKLRIPIYDSTSKKVNRLSETEVSVAATQKIDQSLWPLHFHFKGDPVVPGNFGTHGMIALLKETAGEEFGLKDPVFTSMSSKKFMGMIFENPKQIRFELNTISQSAEGAVVAKEANLYLEREDGTRMIETPIYAFKKLTVTERI